jgi:uncharacterized protein DUF5715
MGRDAGRPIHWLAYGLAAAMLAAVGAALFRPELLVGTGPAAAEDTHIAPPPQVPAPAVNKWKEAAKRIEEERGEPTGRRARVSVPAQLRHYSDTRRFLAIQVAGWREQNYELPHDEAGLAELIRRGEFVEVKPVTDDYILYGVGANASGEPLVHFDRRSGREVTLYPRWDAFDDARAASAADVEARNAAIEALRAEFRKTAARTRAGRARRKTLDTQVKRARAEVAAMQRRIAGDAAWYDDYDRRQMLVGEWDMLQQTASSLGGRAYDLGQAGDRRAFRARLLSFVRPEALAVMEDIAVRYRAEFGRPLAFTSLVRSEHYQLQLGETNANATKIAVAPHTTGLAFDIFYRYMTAAEQHSIMATIGGMESAGRLEALRENRDHYHVFAFAQGRRPSEQLIADALGDVRPVRLASARSSTVKKARASVSRGPGARKAAAPTRRAAPRRATRSRS